MAEEDRIRFSNAFGTFSVWDRMTEDERAIWARLSMLHDAAMLSDADWSVVRTAFAQAVDKNDQRRDFAGYVQQSIGHDSLGLKPEPVASNPTYAALDRQICLPYVARA